MPILNIPFPYTFRGSFRKSSPARSIPLAGFFEVDVPLVERTRAPIVLEVESRRSGSVGVKIAYRKSGDVLLRPLPAKNGSEPSDFADPVTLAGAQRRLDWWTTPAASRKTPYVLTSTGSMDCNGGRSDVGLPTPFIDEGSDRAEREEAARREWEKAAFIDGVLYVPSSGPALRIPTYGRHTGRRDANNRIVYVALMELVPEIGWAASERNRAPFFHISKQLEAEATAELLIVKLRKKFGDGRFTVSPEAEQDFRIVSGDPMTLAADDAVERLTAKVRQVLWDTRMTMGFLDPDGMRAYAALRDAHGLGAAPDVIAPLACALVQEGLRRTDAYRARMYRELEALALPHLPAAAPGLR